MPVGCDKMLYFAGSSENPNNVLENNEKILSHSSQNLTSSLWILSFPHPDIQSISKSSFHCTSKVDPKFIHFFPSFHAHHCPSSPVGHHRSWHLWPLSPLVSSPLLPLSNLAQHLQWGLKCPAECMPAVLKASSGTEQNPSCRHCAASR